MVSNDKNENSVNFESANGMKIDDTLSQLNIPEQSEAGFSINQDLNFQSKDLDKSGKRTKEQ